MTEASRDDIIRIHNRIDESNDRINEMSQAMNRLVVSLERVATTLEGHVRPCPDHNYLAEKVAEHVRDHKMSVNTFATNARKTAWDLVKMGLVALVAFFLANR